MAGVVVSEYVFAVLVTVLERVLDTFGEMFVGFDDVGDDTVERAVLECSRVLEDLSRHLSTLSYIIGYYLVSIMA